MKVFGLVLILVLSMFSTALVPSMFNDGSETLDDSLTSVNGFKAANGFWEQRLDYDWSISKTVNEDAIALYVGESTVLNYEIAVEKELANETNVYGVFGGIYVINSGSSATEGLTITDTVLYSLDGGESFEEIVTANVDTSPKPVLQADGDFYNYPYLINFEPIDGAIYKNSVVVELSNGDGFITEKEFSLPEAPLALSTSDAEALVTDTFDVPAGWGIIIEDEGPWSMTESGIITVNVTVTNEGAIPGTTGELKNLARVTEVDTERTSIDSETVLLTSVGLASIDVTKTGPECAWEGKTVTYTITVTNDGEVDLYAVSVIDQTIDFYANLTMLAAGDSFTWEVEFVIPQLPECMDHFCNQVTAVGWHKINCHPTYQVIDHDYWCIKIWHPGMDIQKWAESDMLPEGHPITYFYTVTNTGDSPLNNVRVFDDQLGWFYLDDYEADGTLASGESWSFSVVSSIPVTGETDRWCYCNIATAYGDICEGTWNASTEWCVEVVRPDISVTKWSPCAMSTPGRMIPYYVNVTNTGNINLSNVYINDTLFGEIYLDGDGTLSPGETWEMVLWYELFEDNGQPWTLCNNVAAYGFVCHVWISDEASWCIDIVHPSIDIDKTADTTEAVEGQTVVFTLTVTNTGDVELSNVRVNDTLAGWFYLDGDGILSPGEVWIINYDYIIPVTENQSQYMIYNLATAYGTFCDDDVSDVDDFDLIGIMIVHPCINIVKTVDYDTIVEGHTVTYTVNVTNCGDVALGNVRVYDTLVDETFYLDGGTLAIGQSWEFTYTYEIPVTGQMGQYQICNTATVYADVIGTTISDNDSACVTVIHPCIDVTKWSPSTMIIEGHSVTYYINVTNCGDVALENVRIFDSLTGWVYMPWDTEGEVPTSVVIMGGTLQPGETWYYQYDYVVPSQTEMLCNTVTAYADICHATINDSASWCIDIVHPSIDIVKTVDYDTIVEGHTVTYTVNVTNDGDVALENVRVYDTLLDETFYLVGGTLAAGASWEFTYTYEIPVTNLDYQYEICNRAIVYADICHVTIDDCDSACVTVVHPCIDIVKTVDYDTIVEGHTVTYTVCVTNCGDVDLENVRVWDDLLEKWFYLCENGNDALRCLCDPPIGQDCVLSPDETWCFTYEYTIPGTDLNEQYQICNTATVYADICHATISANDSACVTVVHPCIDIVKTVDHEMIVEGHTVTYTVNVTNCGDVDLEKVSVYDSLLDETFYFDGGTLAAGESWVFTYTYEIPVTDCDYQYEICNTATVYGYLCHAELTDCDSVCVTVVHPDIEVIKTGCPCVVVEGHPVLWTITVTNTGDVALEDVYVYDEMLGGNFYKVDYTGNGTLGVGENWTIQIEWTVPYTDLNEQYTIQNCATGYGRLCHGWVDDTGCACIRVVHPDIEVTKWSPYTMMVEEHWVTYYINVTNTGDVELYGVYVYDDLLEQFLYLMDENGNGILMPGETWEITLEYYIEATDLDRPWCLKNSVEAFGSLCHATYSDKACWCIMVYHPEVSIEKTANMAISVEGHPIVYTINVTNTGDSLLFNVRVYDEMFGWFYLHDYQEDGTLNAGESWVFNINYTIPNQDPCADEIWEVCNTASVKADFCHATLTDSDCWCIEVVHPRISLDKSINCDAAEPGDTVTYQFTVTNTGDIELQNIVVEDADIGMIYNLPVSLGPGATYCFSWDFTIPMDTTDDPFCNWATVTGYVITDDNCHVVSVSDSDCAVLDIMHPRLNVLKFGPDYAMIGDIVIFSIWVQNTGDVPLKNVVLVDGCWEWYLGDLDIGQEKVRFAIFVITCETPDPFCNTAYATAKYWSCVDECKRTLNDNATKCVDIVHPSIDLVKTGPGSVQPGPCGQMPCCIEYNFTITNNGDVPLTGVVLVDELLGLNIYIGDLDVGQTVYRNACYELPGLAVRCPIETPNDCIVNKAVVTGFYLEKKVCDESSWTTCIIGEEPYYSATQGYWKNHPDAWVGISPDDQFPWVDANAFPGGLTYMQVLWTSPAGGDASMILAHQYIAAKLNDNAWGISSEYADYLTQAANLLAQFPVGSDPQGGDRDEAINLAAILDAYNNGGIKP